DQGEGFDDSKIPDPLDPENLLKPSGRGIFYVRSFMDDVRYRVLPGGGLEMRMEKRLNHQKQGDENEN
ncbi:MAG: ATP-binding protein, partial [Acidobacteriota bacterium]